VAGLDLTQSHRVVSERHRRHHHRAPSQAQIDNDGNAVFGFWGRECAAGTSQVIADVEAGTNPTYVTSYTVEAPAPPSNREPQWWGSVSTLITDDPVSIFTV